MCLLRLLYRAGVECDNRIQVSGQGLVWGKNGPPPGLPPLPPVAGGGGHPSQLIWIYQNKCLPPN